MKVGDILLPRVQYPDDLYRIVGLDATEARLQAMNFGRGGKTVTLLAPEILTRFTAVVCKNCRDNPATVLHGRTLNEKEIADNKAWSDSFKDGFHTGHCPHLELPQQPWCQTCHEAV